MAGAPNPFWDFSVELYGIPEVSKACLTLQNRHITRADVDVNVLLFCVWAAAVGHGELSDGEVLGAVAAVRPWREDVLLPLRGVRLHLDEGVEPVPIEISSPLEGKVTHIELEVERIEQLLLLQLIDAPPRVRVDAEEAAEAAVTSFGRYFSRLGVTLTDADDADLGRILAAAFRPGPRIS